MGLLIIKKKFSLKVSMGHYESGCAPWLSLTFLYHVHPFMLGYN